MKTINRQESAIPRTNRMKGTLNLAAHPDFAREYGPYGPNGNPAGYFSYSHLGYEVRLRFSQITYEWLATCPHFNIKINFPHQPLQDIQELLNNWLQNYLIRPLEISF